MCQGLARLRPHACVHSISAQRGRGREATQQPDNIQPLTTFLPRAQNPSARVRDGPSSANTTSLDIFHSDIIISLLVCHHAQESSNKIATPLEAARPSSRVAQRCYLGCHHPSAQLTARARDSPGCDCAVPHGRWHPGIPKPLCQSGVPGAITEQDLTVLPGRRRWVCICILLTIAPPSFASPPVTHPMTPTLRWPRRIPFMLIHPPGTTSPGPVGHLHCGA